MEICDVDCHVLFVVENTLKVTFSLKWTVNKPLKEH